MRGSNSRQTDYLPNNLTILSTVILRCSLDPAIGNWIAPILDSPKALLLIVNLNNLVTNYM